MGKFGFLSARAGLGFRGWAVLGMLLATLGTALPSRAALTQYWIVESPEDFLKCTSRGVARGGEARAELAPTLDSLGDVGEPLVWAVAPGLKGTVYAGTGHGGKIYRSSGSGFKEWASTGESEVLSMVPDGKGGVYAGTGPKAKIVHVDVSGKLSPVAALGAEYVWALLMDRDGSLLAATGALGKIFRVSSSGVVEDYWTAPAGHVVCLAWSARHTLLAGGEEDGVLYEIAERGKGRAIFDSGEKEIHSIAVTPGGEIYFSALKISFQLPGPVVSAGAPAGIVADKGQKSSIWRLLPNGAAVKVWDGPGLTYALLAHGGAIYAATGEEAQLLRLAPDGSWAKLADLDPGSILCAASDGQDILLGTSTPGQVFALRPSRRSSGTLDSYPLDGRRVARWGGLFAETRGAGSTKFLVRSGNSEKPDAGWSDWAPYSGGNISAPAARFLQWRAQLSGDESLRRVRVAYREQNLPPEVSGVRIMPQEPRALLGPPDGAGSVSQVLSGGVKVEYSLPRAGLRPQSFDVSAWARGIRTIRWDASDPNSDPLRCDLAYRVVGEKTWRPLAHGLEESLFAWDVTSVPDGEYEVKVTVSDSVMNVPSEALAASRVSDPATVDHTPPTWSGLAGERSAGMFRVKGHARDERSPLVWLAWSLDGGDWVMAESADGVVDSRDEDVSFDVPGLPRGEHTVVVKAVDLSGNVGTATLNVR